MGKTNRAKTRRNLRFVLFALLFLCASAPFFGATALADSGLTISTTFPEQTVQPGSNTVFSIAIKNDTGADRYVSMSVKAPDGWSCALNGGGNAINKVFVPGGSSEKATLTVSVPADCPAGDYRVDVTGRDADGISDTLSINIKCAETSDKIGEWTAIYLGMKGSRSDEFKFSTSITNGSDFDLAYSLSAQAPEGWQVSFIPSNDSQQIASCMIKGNGKQGVDVRVKPAYDSAPGIYDIHCSAASQKGTLSLDLKVMITGAYEMTISTPDGRLNANAYEGSRTSVTLEIRNTGSSDLSDIQLIAKAPSNMKVSFSSNKIDSIPAGGKKEVTAYIQASSGSIAGDYSVVFTASSEDATASSEFRVTLTTSSFWGFVGIIIILLLIAGLMFVFRKYGRR